MGAGGRGKGEPILTLTQGRSRARLAVRPHLQQEAFWHCLENTGTGEAVGRWIICWESAKGFRSSLSIPVSSEVSSPEGGKGEVGRLLREEIRDSSEQNVKRGKKERNKERKRDCGSFDDNLVRLLQLAAR